MNQWLLARLALSSTSIGMLARPIQMDELSFWVGLRWHSVLKDKQAIQSNPMEGKRVGVDPYIAFSLLSCWKFKVPVFTPYLYISHALAKVTWEDFCERADSVF